MSSQPPPSWLPRKPEPTAPEPATPEQQPLPLAVAETVVSPAVDLGGSLAADVAVDVVVDELLPSATNALLDAAETALDATLNLLD